MLLSVYMNSNLNEPKVECKRKEEDKKRLAAIMLHSYAL